MLSGGACDEAVPPPPEEDAPPNARAELPLDLAHRARFSADRMATFSNVVLVWQIDPIDPSASSVSLTTELPAPDGSRIIFGAFVRATSLESLRDDPVTFAGATRLDLRGNGIFTPLAAYQPKFARLKLTRIENDEVEGAVRGEFAVFKPSRPSLRPETIEAELTFVAKLIDRSKPVGP